MQEKVCRSRVAKVNELEMRLIEEWGRFDQSIVDAAIAASTMAPSSQRLCPWIGAHLENQA